MRPRRKLGILARVRRRLVGQRQVKRAPAWVRVERGQLEGLELALPADWEANPWARNVVVGEYERGLLDALAPVATGGGVLYDVGAHIGYLSCAWIRLGGSRVEAFEPFPDSAGWLRAMVDRNQLSDAIRVHEVAIANSAGQAILRFDDRDLGVASMSYLEGMGGTRRIRARETRTTVVEVRRLDDLLEDGSLPPPAAIKVDVEGAEDKVMAGARRLLVEHRPVVFCELHSLAATVGVSHLLASLGYDPSPVGDSREEASVYTWFP